MVAQREDVRVRGSICMRVMMAMWMARLRCRSPLRLMRCWTVFPEDAGVGLKRPRFCAGPF